MRRWRVLEALVLGAGLAAIAAAPRVAIWVIVAGIPIILVAAGFSIVYLARLYRIQPVPRSRFFGMLLGILLRGELAGCWLGYVVLARVSHATGGIELPVPSAEVTTAISGLVILVFLASPVAYAWTIFRIRRDSLETTRRGVAEEIDRNGA